jgi:cobalamin biosynthesis protein CobT
VKAGTVFQLHHEPKDDWLEWQGKYSPGKGKDEKKQAQVEDEAGADEEAGDEAGQEEPEPSEDEAEGEEPEPTEDKEDKGFLRGIFDRGD